MVQCLLEHGADKDKRSNFGDTPVFVASQNGHLAVVQYLVEEQGVDVNKATIEARGTLTPLHAAVPNGFIDVAVCLMERGMADLNARTNNGQRPMDLAPNQAMRQAIINEEKRRRDHGFKRSVVLPTPPTIAVQESNENEEEEEDDENEDSDSSDEEDDN